ncbi:MAG TPA: Ig-like domain-containing protein [Gemmatimonadaceae bacterium]|nr:Ig-like domain-containing protein [Gemmatimonadaceae bacterium]
MDSSRVPSRSIAIARRTVTWLVAAVVGCSGATVTDSVGGGDIASIEVTPPSSSLALGAQLPLQAVAKDPDGKIVSTASVVWSVKDPTIASVSNAGVVTGLALGTTQVAASASGKSGIAAITVQRTPVASVIVRPNHIDASPGAHTPLTAITYDGANNILSDRAVIWTSSNDGVATVNASGMVTAVAPGNATITGTAEGKSDAATITVTQGAVATVAVTPSPLTITVGQTSQLTATPRDANNNPVTGRPVSWSSDNTAVATVSSTGLVTAVAAGTAAITATVDGKTGTAAITVSNVPVASVTVLPPSANMAKGSSTQFSAVLKDANGTALTGRLVAWSSSDASVVSVSESGLATAVGAGTATISATSEGITGTAAVTVSVVSVASVTVTPSPATVSPGGTVALTATVKDAGGNVLTGQIVAWSTSNPGIATVSSTGVVTGVAAGTVTITATSGGKSGTSTVTVATLPVGSVTVTPSPTSIIIGQSTTLTATVKDVNGTTVTRPVTWSSSNTAKATVNSSGVVTSVDTGKVTITATSEGVSGTASVTILPVPVASVTVSPATATIGVGKTVTLGAVTKDANGNVLTGRTITWSTSDATVATVSSTGVVTGAGSGGKTATITATSEGKSGTATITVTLVPVGSVTVTPSPASVIIGQTTQLTATVKDTNGLVVTDRAVTWTSSNTAIATVSSTGLVTGVTVGGPITITAKAETKTGTTSLTVTPVPVATVTVQPPSATILQNQTTTFNAVTKDANGNVVTGRTITWSSSSTTVATINSSGTATGGAAGVTTITATSEGKSGTATLTVNLATVASVIVSPFTAVVSKGHQVQLGAAAQDSNGQTLQGRTFTWTSSNTSIATVSSSGLVTGVSAGIVTITATETVSGKSGTSTITVGK